MHKAFWDSLAASLQEDPPDYTHALVLLKEVKEVTRRRSESAYIRQVHDIVMMYTSTRLHKHLPS